MLEQPKVIIRCLVYNHEPYLRDCLEGFVMQKTNFPFKAVVHDDCSTDGSAAIIREYAEKYPHIIEPIYETENQYSKGDGSIRRIMNAATLGRSPYIAYCEGDDYWIDPLKLQKQVDYMDAHPECSMVCTNVELSTPCGIIRDMDKKSKGWFYHSTDRVLTVDDMINNCGYTCTLVLRSDIYSEYPEVCKRCITGDYALQIFASLKGDVYCLADKTSVYRYQSQNSYTSNYKSLSISSKIRVQMSIIKMLDGLNKYSNFKYKKNFNGRIYDKLMMLKSREYPLKLRLYALFRALNVYPIKSILMCLNYVKEKFRVIK